MVQNQCYCYNLAHKLGVVYKLEITFHNLEGVWGYYTSPNIIHLSYSILKREEYLITNVLLHEFAHYWLAQRNLNIKGIHGEYLAEYFSMLHLHASKKEAHLRALEYSQSDTVIKRYPRIKYPFPTLEKAKRVLEAKSTETKKLLAELV